MMDLYAKLLDAWRSATCRHPAYALDLLARPARAVLTCTSCGEERHFPLSGVWSH